MERHLNLIKNEEEVIEKRVLPRFPFNFLIFKSESSAGKDKTFEVRDISFTGMSLLLKDNNHDFVTGGQIYGTLQWKGHILLIKGIVKWIKDSLLGIHFASGKEFEKDIKNFFSVKNIAKTMRPIHEEKLDLELPSNLKYWLRSDGPFELFVWQHTDGEIAKINFIMLDKIIEWEDGKGVQSGRIISRRDLDLPLNDGAEFEVLLDNQIDQEKIKLSVSLIEELPIKNLPKEVNNFITRKLRV